MPLDEADEPLGKAADRRRDLRPLKREHHRGGDDEQACPEARCPEGRRHGPACRAGQAEAERPHDINPLPGEHRQQRQDHGDPLMDRDAQEEVFRREGLDIPKGRQPHHDRNDPLGDGRDDARGWPGKDPGGGIGPAEEDLLVGEQIRGAAEQQRRQDGR